MDDLRMQVNEDQIDALAGRVAELERQISNLVKLLSQGTVGHNLGVDERYFSIVTQPLCTAPMARAKHANERAKALETAERDQFMSRIKRAEALASLTLTPFPEAWESMNQALHPRLDHGLVAGFKKKGRAGRAPVPRPRRASGR